MLSKALTVPWAHGSSTDRARKASERDDKGHTEQSKNDRESAPEPWHVSFQGRRPLDLPVMRVYPCSRPGNPTGGAPAPQRPCRPQLHAGARGCLPSVKRRPLQPKEYLATDPQPCHSFPSARGATERNQAEGGPAKMTRTMKAAWLAGVCGILFVSAQPSRAVGLRRSRTHRSH